MKPTYHFGSKYVGNILYLLRASMNRAFEVASNSDYDFPSSVSLLQITDGLWNFSERVSPVDDRCELLGFDELLED